MAFTYSKLAEVTVGSGGASSITFSNIPQNYTDLVVKYSIRCNRASPNYGDMSVRFNGTTTNYTQRNVLGDGSSPSSSTALYVGIDSAFATVNTFSNIELYLPNYSGSANKSFSMDTVTENNATEVRTVLSAGLWSNVAAINSINILEINGNSFVQYSTATLYGVRVEL